MCSSMLQIIFTFLFFFIFQIGESLLVSILDASGHNPKSLISSSSYLSIQGVKEWLKQHALSLRGRCGPGYVSKYAAFSRARYLFVCIHVNITIVLMQMRKLIKGLFWIIVKY